MNQPSKLVVQKYLNKFEKAKLNNDTLEVCWECLRNAHIASQPSTGQHTKVHLIMLLFAWNTRNRKELFGQIVRLILAAPGSLFGKYPQGNPGTSDISMFKVCPIPEELKAELESTKPTF